MKQETIELVGGIIALISLLIGIGFFISAFLFGLK